MGPEIYPHAPVVLVAIEVRHPPASMSNQTAAHAKKLLADVCPLSRPATVTTINTVAGQPPDVKTSPVTRFMSRDRTLAVSFQPEAVLVETTKHDRYERLRSVLKLAVTARQDMEPVDGLDRIGLRYIDEVRVPSLSEDLTTWSDWVDESLLGPARAATPLGLAVEQWQGVTQFATNDGNTLVLRYGPRHGYSVDPAGDLKRPTPPPGPFFLLDLDSFWSAGEVVPPFELNSVLERADALHTPVRSMFESLITDRLREEVLRDAGRRDN